MPSPQLRGGSRSRPVSAHLFKTTFVQLSTLATFNSFKCPDEPFLYKLSLLADWTSDFDAKCADWLSPENDTPMSAFRVKALRFFKPKTPSPWNPMVTPVEAQIKALEAQVSL